MEKIEHCFTFIKWHRKQL